MKQTDSGKAFEYQLANELARFLNIPFSSSSSKEVAEKCLLLHSPKEQSNMQRAADEATTFLACHDDRFKLATAVGLQTDMHGRRGDVRDVVLTLPDGEIGISAKNRHDAVKHSRLSDTIDFGKEWADYPCSAAYMKRIAPVFADMRTKGQEGVMFRDIPDKVNRYYLPVLMAFEDELRRLCEDFGQRFVKRLFQYLLGSHDFYKVIKENGHVAIISCNINGELKWGKHWKIPERIEDIKRKRGSSNTLIVSFEGGWQISFRVHNAASKVEPSLKFDIRFTGFPPTVARHEIQVNYDIAPV